jgi:4'-phosphopantetheinyl transferase EntD
VTVGARAIGDRSMFEVERAHVSRAIERRVQEFGSGRALLRELIGRDIPIPVGSNRAPVLPPDVCGSLAHDDGFVIAAVADRRLVQSIGIDIEPVGPLDEPTTRAILRPDEDFDAHLAFTLKEATYKAWSGLGGRMLEFHDVRLSVMHRGFTAEVGPERQTFDGLFEMAAERWIALVVVPTDPGQHRQFRLRVEGE